MSSRLLRDAVLQTSVGSEIGAGHGAFGSLDERFVGGKVKKGSLAAYPHLASLEMGPGAGVLVDRAFCLRLRSLNVRRATIEGPV